MYNPREELFERDEDYPQSNVFGNASESSSIQTSSRSTNLSYSLSIFEESDDEIFFPSYEEDNKSNTKYPRNKQARRVESPAEISSTRPERVPIERSEDDLAACEQPSRHVDYLSHDWTEEEIWSSWKYIVSKRNSCPNSERLENAAWRTWEQKRRNLKTVSPETIKWLKDHDVTWLYGPLQPSCSTPDRGFSADDNCKNSMSHSACQSKKPCLKKQTLSELMLRRSESSASLLKEAVATVEAQKSRTEASRHGSYFNLTRASTGPVDIPSLTSSSSPDLENSKNVRFHEIVEQCIALVDFSTPDDDALEDGYASDSEEDEVVVIRRPLKPRRNSRQWLPSFQEKKAPISKTIEKLPQALLKSPSETESEESSAYEYALNNSRHRPQLASLPSPQPTPLVFYDDAESDNDEYENEYWKPPTWLQNRKDSVQIFHDKLESIKMQSPPFGISRDSSFLHRPLLERRDEATQNVPHVCKGSKRESRSPRIAFGLPPCRSQLANFSLIASTRTQTQTQTPDPSDGDDESEVSPSQFSDSSASDSPEHEEDEYSDDRFDDPKSGTWSPRTSSDSGYGSEERNEAWRVRDTSGSREEKEKGVRDWETYREAWDEVDDEAIAWDCV